MGYRYTALLGGGGPGPANATGSKRGTNASLKKPKKGAKPVTTAAAAAAAGDVPKKRGRPPKNDTSITAGRPKATSVSGDTSSSPDVKRPRSRKVGPDSLQQPHKKLKSSSTPLIASNEASGSAAPVASMVKSKIVKRPDKVLGARNIASLRPISPRPPSAATSALASSSPAANVGQRLPPLPPTATAAATAISKGVSKVIRRKTVKTPMPLASGQYKLAHVLKGHVEADDLTDEANIWACDFEPESNELVAIAGSDTILFLNVPQARYVKKYAHVEPREEFKCLAWTLLRGPQELLDDDASEDSKCTVLAAAGRLGSIKLVNALQSQCFRHLFGHEKQVRKLQFSKTSKRWLFSASDDMTVRLWDMGAPNNNQENTSMCLAKFVIPSTASIPTALSAHGGDMIVGCSEGQLVKYKIGKIKSDGDAGIIKHKELYPSGDEWHEGYVDDIFVLGQQGKGYRHALDGCIVSRGSDDYETLIWRPKSSTKKDADIAISLDWPESAEQEGLRFKLVEKDEHKVLVAGDYDGQIRIYNFGDGRLSRTLEDNSKEVIPATKVLSHPMSSKLIRDITISEDARTIVAVDSANNVFIWQCT